MGGRRRSGQDWWRSAVRVRDLQEEERIWQNGRVWLSNADTRKAAMNFLSPKPSNFSGRQHLLPHVRRMMPDVCQGIPDSSVPRRHAIPGQSNHCSSIPTRYCTEDSQIHGARGSTKIYATNCKTNTKAIVASELFMVRGHLQHHLHNDQRLLAEESAGQNTLITMAQQLGQCFHSGSKKSWHSR